MLQNKSTITTPVAFLIFKRPDLTQIVFEAIRKAKPKKLLVVADGPRFPEEAEKCQQARAVIERVDWDCEVLTKFSEKNLGCKQCVSSGLDWVFSEVEEAIILEDDCLPSPSFFSFCQSLLEYYRHDERIMNISGNNFQRGQSRTDYSYYFSKYPHTWGWASWQRAWKFFDKDMKTWTEFNQSKMIESFCENFYEKQYWTSIFDSTYKGDVDTWDYQWYYACWTQNGLSITPNANLVSNLGFRPDATHTFDAPSYAKMPVSDIWEIKHPSFVVTNREADAYTFDYRYDGKKLREQDTFRGKIRKPISKFKNLTKRYLSI